MDSSRLCEILVFVFLFIVLIGCSTSHPYKAWNDAHVKNKSPVRFVKDESFIKPNSERYRESWAGIKGESAVSDRYKTLAFNAIKKQCGYGEIVEFRVVSHAENSWEEVWLFNDAKSFRVDKISGLTVFFKYNPSSKMTNTTLYGACHTKKGISITNSQ